MAMLHRREQFGFMPGKSGLADDPDPGKDVGPEWVGEQLRCWQAAESPHA